MLSFMIIPRILQTEYFPKFGYDVNSQKIFVYDADDE